MGSVRNWTTEHGGEFVPDTESKPTLNITVWYMVYPSDAKNSWKPLANERSPLLTCHHQYTLQLLASKSSAQLLGRLEKYLRLTGGMSESTRPNAQYHHQYQYKQQHCCTPIYNFTQSYCLGTKSCLVDIKAEYLFYYLAHYFWKLKGENFEQQLAPQLYTRWPE